MIDNVILLSVVLLFCSSCTATKPPGITEYPRMPDEYRDNGNDKANRNPFGMSIYDAAEAEAEEDYFGTEVVSLEESRRIINERKKQQKEQEE